MDARSSCQPVQILEHQEPTVVDGTSYRDAKLPARGLGVPVARVARRWLSDLERGKKVASLRAASHRAIDVGWSAVLRWRTMSRARAGW